MKPMDRCRRNCFSRLLPLALILSACAGNDRTDCASDIGARPACPRPVAYPRPFIYDSVYVTAPDMPVLFEVNANASLYRPDVNGSAPAGTRWLNVVYPAYSATLFCTFSPVSSDGDRRRIVENRMQRMMMNLGDNYATQFEIASPDGYSTMILSSLGPTLTPVQFISQSRRWVISGTMQFEAADGRPLKPDSVKPYIDAVAADLIHAAGNLK